MASVTGGELEQLAKLTEMIDEALDRTQLSLIGEVVIESKRWDETDGPMGTLVFHRVTGASVTLR